MSNNSANHEDEGLNHHNFKKFLTVVWLNLKTIKFCVTKLATDFYWQPSYLMGEIPSLFNEKIKWRVSVFSIFYYSQSHNKHQLCVSLHFFVNEIKPK
jgi:hypothetical protein